HVCHHARGEANHWWPERLPGGHAVLCTVMAATGGLDAASLAVVDLKSGRPTILVRGGTHAQYMPSGHLVYATAGALRAVGFDLTRLVVVGTASPVVSEMLTTAFGAAEAELARDGTLVYVAGAAGSGSAQTLVWVDRHDRQGRERPTGAPERSYGMPRVSAD